MGAEKESDITPESNLPDDGSGIQIGETKRTTAAIQEAADIYGDISTAQELGYVQRGYVHLAIFNHLC